MRSSITERRDNLPFAKQYHFEIDFLFGAKGLICLQLHSDIQDALLWARRVTYIIAR
jgi:hypothetical protein